MKWLRFNATVGVSFEDPNSSDKLTQIRLPGSQVYVVKLILITHLIHGYVRIFRLHSIFFIPLSSRHGELPFAARPSVPPLHQTDSFLVWLGFQQPVCSSCTTFPRLITYRSTGFRGCSEFHQLIQVLLVSCHY